MLCGDVLTWSLRGDRRGVWPCSGVEGQPLTKEAVRRPSCEGRIRPSTVTVFTSVRLSLPADRSPQCGGDEPGYLRDLPGGPGG